MTQMYAKGTRGCIKQPRTECVLIHDSPADQETIEVVLLDDYRCLEKGELIEIQRNLFEPFE